MAKTSETDGDRPETAAAKRRGDDGDQSRQRADAIDDHERAADEQGDGDDVGGGDEAARNRHEHGEGPTGAAGDGDVGPRDGHDAAGRGIVSTVVLAGREHPGEGRGDDDCREEEGEGMRQPKRHRVIPLTSRTRRC